MNAAKLNLEKYRGALTLRAAELRKDIGLREAIAVETAPDAFDNRLLAAERELAVQRLAESHRLLRLTEAALARLKNGDYGICLKCEEEIAPRRLDAVPWAAFCLGCQETVDRSHDYVRGLVAA